MTNDFGQPLLSLHQQAVLQQNSKNQIPICRVQSGNEMVHMFDSKGRPYEVNLFDLYGSARAIRASKRNRMKQAATKQKLQTVSEVSSATPTDEVPLAEPPKQEEEPKPPLPAADQAEASNDNVSKEWTVEKDGTILTMKEDAKECSAIAAALGKTEAEVEARYKSLMETKAANAEAKGKEKADGEISPVVEVDGDADDDDKSDIDPFVEGTKATKYDVADPTPVKLDEIEQSFDVQEVMLIVRLHDSFENQKWQAIASRFYDETGRRIKPEVLRHCFG